MDISFLLTILSLFMGTLSLFLAVKTARKIYKKKKERNAYWKEHLETFQDAPAKHAVFTVSRKTRTTIQTDLTVNMNPA